MTINPNSFTVIEEALNTFHISRPDSEMKIWYFLFLRSLIFFAAEGKGLLIFLHFFIFDTFLLSTDEFLCIFHTFDIEVQIDLF